MKKRLITMLLAASLTVASFAGCGSKEVAKSSETAKESSSAVSTSASSTVQEEVPYFNEEGYPIVNEEITLKIMYQCLDNVTIIDPKDMDCFKDLEEKTGIKTEWEVIKAADWSTKLNLAFASGEYPDVIIALGSGLVDYEKYGVEQGIVVPLDNLMDEYMPIYNERKAQMEVDTTTRLLASDGHFYAMPYMFGKGYDTDIHYFINEAWLGKLGLEMPTDIESLTEVLRAFKTKDPNGNGEADEIPMVATLDELYCFTQLFGMPKYAKWMYIDDNKQIQFVPYMEKFREFLEWAHMCYDEGLLDPEVLTQDGNAVKAKLADGDAGFFRAYRLKNMGFDKSEETCTHYLPDGAVIPVNVTAPSASVYITKTNKYPEATARWIDSLNEVETAYSIYWGEQNNEEFGWKYNEDGTIKLMGKEPEVRHYIGSNFYKFFPESLNEKSENAVEKNGYCAAEKEAGLYQKYSDLNLAWATFAGDKADKKTKFETDLNTAMKEHVSNFVSEGVTDKKWEEFQSVLKNIGMDEYVAMYQEYIDGATLY